MWNIGRAKIIYFQLNTVFPVLSTYKVGASMRKNFCSFQKSLVEICACLYFQYLYNDRTSGRFKHSRD